MAYAYDANGNTLSKTKAGVTTEFLYDIRDQLGEVRQDASTLGRYGYDYDRRRILKLGDDGVRRYSYDQLSVITEADLANATVSKYDYGLDQLVSLDNTVEGRSFFHLDVVHSTASLTDAAGSTRQSIFYDAWGNERDRVGASANKFTFTGHEKDEETGLIYAKARFYDPDVGRFLNQDPLLGVSDNPPSLHRYSYAFSNPLRFVDIDGLQPRTAEAMLQLRIDEIHEQTGAPKALIGLKLAGDLSAVGSAEQVFGTVNVLSLGGAGGVRKGLEEGDISAESSFFENVYASGGSFLSGNVDFVVPGAAEYRAARTQGAGRGDAFVEGLGGAVAVPEFKELFAPDRTAGERFDAATGVAFKLGRLYIIGRLAWGATRVATVETEGTAQNQSIPRPARETQLALPFEEGPIGRAGPRTTIESPSSSVLPRSTTPSTTGGGSPQQLSSGVAWEKAEIARLGKPKNTSVWRPTQRDINSAAFKQIVGRAKFTESGRPVGTTVDIVETGGFIEVKGGTSPLDSSYQLRLQTYQSVTTGTPLTIRTTRPVNPTFSSYLKRWNVKVENVSQKEGAQ